MPRFPPNSEYRARVPPAKRGRGRRHATITDIEEPIPAERCTAMSWAQRLKRDFGVDIETCPACGEVVRIIACLDDPVVIEKILAHLDAKALVPEAIRLRLRARRRHVQRFPGNALGRRLPRSAL